MRATLEIAAKLQEVVDSQQDAERLTIDVLISYLPFDLAKPYLPDDAKEEDWTWITPGEQEKVARQEMAEYMHFAWEQVMHHRHKAAAIGVIKMVAWDWLLSEDGKMLDVRTIGFPKFGAPMFAAFCKKYNFQIPQSELFQNMIAGLPCKPDCDQGCGK